MGELNFGISVIMGTYNQAQYIERAIKSVINQVINCDVELIIIDDHSTDNTQEILKKYDGRWFGKVAIRSVQYYPENVGIAKNTFKAYVAAMGRYIAILDSDDEWTDRFKLLKQKVILDNNQAACLCFTNFIAVSPEGKNVREMGYSGDPTFKRLRQENFIVNSSVMYCKSFWSFPDYFYELRLGDYLLHLCHAEGGGEMIYIPEITGRYMINPNGMCLSNQCNQSVVNHIYKIFERFEREQPK